ncbi:hypothetical protein P8C59_004712 [Phyllachora maydis]|uniref:Uncharacterized protein n=1 Tax=Phyllachora maydis TaxID=1825666 RepID=A0AAD9I477_9PEZI|nr:hypothetical protein P8C59_004712 [Phyllachora maydis]
MSDYKPSAQLTEAVAAAMMEELGSARLDSLPLEDRARDHAYREGTHNNRPGRAKQPNMMQHLSQPAANGGGGLASMWQAAVNSNVFDDIDAQAVRGLSDLGGGRVYVKQGVRKAQAMLKSTGTLQAPGQGRFSANPATQALQAFPKAGAKGGFAPGQAGNTKAEIGNFFQGVVLAIGEAYIKSNDDLAALDDEAQRKAMKDFVAVFFQKSISPGRPEVAQAGAKTQKPQDVPNTTGMAANTRYSVEQLVSGPVVKNPDVLQPGAKSTVNANTETTGVSDKPGVFENVTKAQSTKTTAHANGNGLEESKLVDINHRATLTTKQARKDEGLLASKWATEEDSLVNEKNFTGPAYEFPANSNLWLLAELDPETGLDTKPEIPSNDVANFFLSGPPTQPESTLPTPSQTSSESGKIVLSGPMSSASSVTRGFKGLKASRWA